MPGKLLFLMFFFVSSGAAEAGEELKWRAAVAGGVLSDNKFTGAVGGNVSDIGGEIGRVFMNGMELGYSFSYAGVTSEDYLLQTSGYDLTFHLLFLNIILDRTDKGFYFGPQLGFAGRSLRKSGPDVALNSGVYGLRAGYNYHISDRFSAGAQAQFLVVSGDSATVIENNTGNTYSASRTSFGRYLLLLNYKF